MLAELDLREYPKGYTGRQRYVRVDGYGIIAACYTYCGHMGRNYLHPDFGGDLSGITQARSDLQMPYIVRDIGEYRSPIDNSMITSRSQHRAHLKVHDVVEVGNDRMPSAPSSRVDTREIGEVIKQRIEEVKSLPDAAYKHQIETQKTEHAEVAALVTA